MIFSTLEFVVFFIILLLTYYKTAMKYRWIVLFAGSSVFLAYLSFSFLFYTYAIILVNYVLAIGIDKIQHERRKRILYIFAIVLNIGQLVFYKYINFLLDNVSGLLGLTDISAAVPHINLIAPIGISYFTFETIGYIVDVYRRLEKPERHLGMFATYILFFPKLLAGPIERSRRFLPQLHKRKPWDRELFIDGTRQLVWGLFKKLVVAERLATLIASVYGNVEAYSGYSLLAVLFLQTIYLYTDFSGYTDIALGIGKLLGFRLTNNFERPLFARNVSMFWRKWHISLSSWCNDYIFKRILLSRRRWQKWAAVYGVFMTFLVIGIWHGAGWTFVVLGLLQGLAINYEFFTKRTRLRLASKLPPRLVTGISIFSVVVFYSFSLIFFNAQNLGDAFYFISHMFDGSPIDLFNARTGWRPSQAYIMMAGFMIVLFVDTLHENGIELRNTFYARFTWVRWALYYALILSVIMLGEFSSSNFVYFQF